MSIDVKVEGDAASVRAAGTWLRSTLGAHIADSSRSFSHAASTADGAWSGPAGTAFAGRMREGARRTSALHDAATSGAQGLDDYADALTQAHSDMADVRSAARGAGLSVTAVEIADPGAGPARPTRPALGASTREIESYDDASTRYTAHQAKLTAYRTAQTNAQTVRTHLAAAKTHLAGVKADVETVMFPTASTFLGGATGVSGDLLGGLHASQAKWLEDSAASYEANARGLTGAHSPDFGAKDFEDAAKLRASAADSLESSSRAIEAGKSLGLLTGGALTGVGIWYDMNHGEGATQAVTSNLVGFGASIAAGAAIGTLIPVPVVGTVAGAVVGGVVGIFTSGMVDGMFENGPDVGAALSGGWNDLKDTGEALGGLADEGVHAAGDGLSHAWHSVFG